MSDAPKTPTQMLDEYVTFLATLPDDQQLAIYKLAEGLMTAIKRCQADGIGLRALALVSAEVAAGRSEDDPDDTPIILLPQRKLQVIQ